MARYLIIDNESGHIAGDTADPRDKVHRVDDPIEACKRLSGTPLVRVSWISSRDSGFRVYLATDFVTRIGDRRHPHVIEMIETECACVAMVKRE